MMIIPRAFLLILLVTVVVNAGPTSKPYVPFRTSPFEQSIVHHNLTLTDSRRSNVKPFRTADKEKCPLQFTLGVSKRTHDSSNTNQALSLVNAPVIYPIHPSRGPGRQVLYATQYEHLDLLTPASSVAQLGIAQSSIIKEGLVQHESFPLLFESSSFHASPIVHDVNGDGLPDAILVDYDGGIYVVGLDTKKGQARYFHRAQVPRIFLRRNWMESRLNETLNVTEEETTTQHLDPYHSYFEYSSTTTPDQVLRGVTADLLGQDHKDIQGLEQRRKRKVHHKRSNPSSASGNADLHPHGDAEPPSGSEHRDAGEHEHGDKGQEEHGNAQHQEEHEDGGEHEQGDVGHEEHGQQEEEHEDVDEREHGDAGHGKNERGDVGQQDHSDAVDHSNNTEQHEQGNAKDQPAEAHGGGEARGDSENAAPKQQQVEPGNAGGNQTADHRRRRRLQEEEEEHDDHVSGDSGDHLHDHDGAFVNHETSRERDRLMEREEVMVDDDDFEQIANHRARGGYVDDDLDAADHEYDEEMEREAFFHQDDDYRGMYDDMYEYRHDHGYDDYRSDGNYYDEKNYIRIPPHVLCDPVLVELPKPYMNNKDEKDTVLVVAVSYFFDEDEYEGHHSYKRFEHTDIGDETEVDRGMYVTNALMFYKWTGEGNGSWGRQEQLDLSGDYTAPQNATLVAAVPFQADDTKMGAFLLSTPTVANVDGDGSLDILLGTSMGLVYMFDAPHLYSRDGWPIQMKHPVESRILVEDVVGDTNLEVFVADTGGNIVCLDARGELLWHRDLLANVGVKPEQMVGSSPMTLGDVDGDGVIDLVVVLCVGEPTKERFYLFAMSAATGKDLASFPINIMQSLTERQDSIQQKIPQPLLVDLHSDQSHWNSYLYRNGTKQWDSKKGSKPPKLPPHGGSAPGLHIVQPIGSDLYFVEAGSGCMQTVAIGDEVTSMVQADDVHGTNSLDLVVSTKSGNIVTLETPAVPFHPLNVWNGGPTRNRGSNVAHGLSASQGIFVRDVSRQYRDIFGIYVPITFEIFDNRPNMRNEEARRIYEVELRDGTSYKRTVMRKSYNAPGVYTERVYVPYGPGYYDFTLLLKTSHGLVYEDRFHVGYNVHFMQGFGMLLWLPLVIAAVPILLCGRKTLNWDDEGYGREERGGRGLGILGRGLPTSA